MDQEILTETYYEDLRVDLAAQLDALAEPAEMPASFTALAECDTHAKVKALIKALLDNVPKAKPLPKNGKLKLPKNLITLGNAESATYYFLQSLGEFFRDQSTYGKALRAYARVLSGALTLIDAELKIADRARARYTEVQDRLRERDNELAALRRSRPSGNGAASALAPKEKKGVCEQSELESLREQVGILSARLERLQNKPEPMAAQPQVETKSPIILGLSSKAPRISFWNSVNSTQDFQNLTEQYPRIFSRREEIAEWARFNLEGRLAVSERAERELAESVYRNVPLMYFSLMLLAYDYRDMVMATNGDRAGLVARFARKAKNLGLTESKSTGFKTMNEMPGEYSACYDGTSYFLDRALKKGASHKPETTFRSYFAYDKDRQLVVVGSMPRHLRNAHGD